MEIQPQIFDFLKFDKQNSSATFNTIAKLRHFFELLLLLGLISWSSAHAPPLFRVAAAYGVELSTYLFNHHVVFLIGNAIIFSLFLLCRRQSDSAASGDDFYDEYAKHSDTAAAEADRADLPPPVENKQIVVRAEVQSQCDENDDVSEAICSARRQIKRFERTQSEKLRREIKATLRRSETEVRRKSVDAAEIERLSSEEFQRKIDAFIDENWSTKKK
ncbi:uncharacterized protein LOC125201701 [Salvia hispanica]|uniref:uncharacterized protein LOC125201701 n=1 Tax=Salvia hispanica TaxID=49212 RepID=UPI0020090CA1|nr:uncharacterized protein LOC125201701 [Salvia hispanica]